MRLERIVSLLCCLVLLITASPMAGASDDGLADQAIRLLRHLETGEHEQAMGMMNDAMQDSLAALWPQLTALGGKLVDRSAPIAGEADGYRIIWINLFFERAQLNMRCVFDEAGLVAGLFVTPGHHPQPEPVPEGIRELEVTVDDGFGYPLAGRLTLPLGEPVASVLLLPGSGPTDMDERFGANAPLRDLAHGLASRGIASLRYDKRTFTYASKLAALPSYPRFTVSTEYREDALAAIQLIQSHQLLADKPLYLLGHSLGASVLPFVDGGTNSLAQGFILLAGTPRNLLSIMIEQFRLVAAEMEAAGEADAAAVRAEMARLESLEERLGDLTPEELLMPENAVGGMFAYYLQHLLHLRPSAGYRQANKPMLVLWGEKDRQVYREDYELWQQELQGMKDVTFKAYPALNHLFGDYQGDPVPFSQLVTVEYAQRTPVAEEVIQDIAAWITERAKGPAR